MIPIVIQQAVSNEYKEDTNIHVTFHTCEKTDMDKFIIRYITSIIYEFCCEEVGNNIQISSYEDFCFKYWTIVSTQPTYWFFIFKVYYFDKKWIEWHVLDHREKIYNSCVKSIRTQT